MELDGRGPQHPVGQDEREAGGTRGQGGCGGGPGGPHHVLGDAHGAKPGLFGPLHCPEEEGGQGHGTGWYGGGYATWATTLGERGGALDVGRRCFWLGDTPVARGLGVGAALAAAAAEEVATEEWQHYCGHQDSGTVGSATTTPTSRGRGLRWAFTLAHSWGQRSAQPGLDGAGAAAGPAAGPGNSTWGEARYAQRTGTPGEEPGLSVP